MRGFSSVASVTMHCGVAAALLFGTAKTVRSNPPRIVPIAVFPSPPERVIGAPELWIPPRPGTASIAVDKIPIPTFRIAGSAMRTTPGVSFSGSVPTAPTSGPAVDWVAVGSENGPEILTGPLPTYPELLRQAGIEGRVIFEAIVDTTGTVLRDSIFVVSGSNAEFVAPARQALLATLFRPAFAAGHAVRTRIRIPFEFRIQNGRAHPR